MLMGGYSYSRLALRSTQKPSERLERIQIVEVDRIGDDELISRVMLNNIFTPGAIDSMHQADLASTTKRHK
jgi:hypothetical protein